MRLDTAQAGIDPAPPLSSGAKLPAVPGGAATTPNLMRA